MAFAAAALLCLPGAAAAATVDARSLRAVTRADPWQLSFTDRAGRVVLEEASGAGLGPVGTVGFRTAAGWFHATREIEGHAEGASYAATLETSDPLGRRIELRLQPVYEGYIALRARVTGGTTADVTATGIAFRARDGERYLGFGERSNAVDQRGGEVEHYTAEGPFQTEERPFVAGFVPPGDTARARTPPTSQCPGSCRAPVTGSCSTTPRRAATDWGSTTPALGASRCSRPSSR